MQGKYACLLTVVAAAVLLTLAPGCQASRILCESENSLNSTELLPHPGSCALYLICDNGVPVVGKCPQGLHFNRDLQVCDWPAAAGCIEAMKKKHQAEKEEAERKQHELEAQTTPETVTTSNSP